MNSASRTDPPGSGEEVIATSSTASVEDAGAKAFGVNGPAAEGEPAMMNTTMNGLKSYEKQKDQSDATGQREQQSLQAKKGSVGSGRGLKPSQSFVSRSVSSKGPRIPFGLSPMVIFIIMTVYAACVGSHFFNWTSWEAIFVRNGFFEDGCYSLNRQEQTSFFEEVHLLCGSQGTALDELLQIAVVCTFSFSLIAGMVLSVIGPRLCCLFGNGLLIISWIFMLAGSFHNGLLKVGFAFMGAGTDPAFFGILSVSNLFPDHSSLIIAVFGAARSLSNLWPFAFNVIEFASGKHLYFVVCAFFILMNIGCFALVYLLVPSQPYRLMVRDPSVVREVTLASQLELATIGAAAAQVEVEDYEDIAEQNEVLKPEMEDAIFASHGMPRIGDTGGPVQSVAATDSEIQLPVQQGSVVPRKSANNSALHRHRAVVKSTSRTSVISKSVSSAPGRAMKSDQKGMRVLFNTVVYQTKTLGQHCLMSLYFPIILASIANVFRNSAYLLAAKDRLGTANAFLQIMNVLAFIPGPICGLILNRWGPFVIMHALNACITITFVFVLVGKLLGGQWQVAFNWMSVVFAFPFIGFLLSQVYCYIAVVFDPADLGKLAGFASFVAGLFGLVVPTIMKSARKSQNFLVVDIVCFVLSGVVGLLIFFLQWRLNVKQKAAAEEEDIENNRACVEETAL